MTQDDSVGRYHVAHDLANLLRSLATPERI